MLNILSFLEPTGANGTAIVVGVRGHDQRATDENKLRVNPYLGLTRC